MNERTVKIGMGQLLVEGGEPERNLTRACAMVEEAVEKKCDIVLLPECLDLAWTHPSAKNEAASIPGVRSDIFCAQAKKNKIYICAGLTEKAGQKVYNSAVLINSDGEIILKYRKINILDVGLEFYSIGNMLSVVETPFGIIGLNICSDNYMDGLVIGHTLAHMGAQIILSPSSWTVDYSLTEAEDPYKEKWITPYSILARQYGLVVVGTTSVGVIVGGPYEGKKMVGCSLAVSAQGIVAQGKYNEFAGELIIADVPVHKRESQGTQIGRMFKEKEYRWDTLP